MTSSAVLQRQADATRAELSTTLDELRVTMTGAALAGGATALAREGAATVARGVVRRASDNPLAALLIGAGVLMLCSSRGFGFSLRSRVNGNGLDHDGRLARARHAIGETVDRTTEAVGGAVDHATSGVRGAVAAATGTVTESAERARQLAAQGREQVSQTIDQAQERALQTSERVSSFVQEQPIVAAALAVAVGAAIGAALPVTEAERRYLGPAASRVTQKGRRVAESVGAAVVPGAASAATDALSRELGDRQPSSDPSSP